MRQTPPHPADRIDIETKVTHLKLDGYTLPVLLWMDYHDTSDASIYGCIYFSYDWRFLGCDLERLCCRATYFTYMSYDMKCYRHLCYRINI